MEKSSTPTDTRLSYHTPEQVEEMQHSLLFDTAHRDEAYDKYYKIKEGDLVLDCGAHVGIYTRQFAAAVGDTGHVYAIEPDYRALGLLALNTEDLSRRITILPYALWHSDQKLQFFIYRHTVGVSSCVVQYKPEVGETYPVSAYRLDSLLRKLGLQDKKISFLKMDIEASELHAISGMADAFRNIDNMAIAAYHRVNPMDRSENALRTFPEVERLLKDAGYDIRTEVGGDGEIVYASRSDFRSQE